MTHDLSMKRAGLAILLALTGCRLDACEAIASRAADLPDLYWRASPVAFDTADIDGDGSDEIVGLCNHVIHEALRLCAYDVAKQKLVWETASLPSDEALAAHVAIRGDRALLVDHTGAARVVSLAGGEELSSRPLAHPASEHCLPAEHPDAVWLRLADDTSFLYTPSSDTLAAAPRPASCRDTDPRKLGECMLLGGPGCGALPPPERYAGHLPMAVAYEGDVGALFATKTGGGSQAVVFGFEIGQTDVLYAHPTRQTDGAAPLLLSNQRVFTKDADEVVALDARSGKTLWRTRSGNFNTLHASATRLYVGRWTAIEVYDASSGERLATIGHR